MKYVVTLVSLFFAIDLFAQECSCKEQFLFVKKYYEDNNPAFQKIKENNELHKEYTDAVARIMKEVSAEKNTDLCNIYFNKYLELLKDHHSSIEFNLQRKNIDFSSQIAIDSFRASPSFKAFRLREVDTTQVIRQLKDKSLNDIEGIYNSKSNITVAIIQNHKDHYEGVVIRKNKLLDVGHILFTLTREEDSSFSCTLNTGLLGFNFNATVMNNVRLRKGSIPKIGFYKTDANSDENLWEFKALNENTYYLSIKSFDYALKPQLDSLYQQIIPKIEQRKFLVLDIRNNGGGSDQNYFEILPLIYTKPMNVDEVQVWVSPDNIKSYEQYQNPNEELLSRMKIAKQFSFIPQKVNAVNKLEMTGTQFPEKIAILYNKGTASSAESLITYAVQSEKVITLGENSGGFMGYGDVISKEISGGKFILYSTTTKYKNNAKYEFVGIAPMISLDRRSDWVQAAISKLNETK